MKKKIIVCFGDKLGTNEYFKKISEDFSKEEFEVHLFDFVFEANLSPHNVLSVLEHFWSEQTFDNEYYFLSNIKDFFKLCYKIYQQTFKEFIYIETNNNLYDIDLDDIYVALLQKKVSKSENIYKKIYTNIKKIDFDDISLNKKCELLGASFASNYKKSKIQQNIYRFGKECYFFEPTLGEPVYIDLDSEKVDDSVTFSDIILPFDIDRDLFKKAEELLEFISRDYEVCLRNGEIIQKGFMLLKAEFIKANNSEKKYLSSLLNIMGKNYGVYTEIFVFSYLLDILKDSEIQLELLKTCLDVDKLSVQNKYFVFCQSKNIKNIVTSDEEKTKLLELELKLFQQIVTGFKEESDGILEKIDKKDLNKENVVLFTSQFLSLDRPHTKYVLELAHTLATKKNKKVWIINTCEYLSQNERVMYFDASVPLVYSEYTNGNSFVYEGERIPFCQMIFPMPTKGGLDGINEFLEINKPGMIINLSELSVASALCKDYIPTVLIPLAEQEAAVTLDNYIIFDEQNIVKNIEAIYKKNKVKCIKLKSSIIKTKIDEFDSIEPICDVILQKVK